MGIVTKIFSFFSPNFFSKHYKNKKNINRPQPQSHNNPTFEPDTNSNSTFNSFDQRTNDGYEYPDVPQASQNATRYDHSPQRHITKYEIEEVEQEHSSSYLSVSDSQNYQSMNHH